MDLAERGAVLFCAFAIDEKIQVVYKPYSVNPEVRPAG